MVGKSSPFLACVLITLLASPSLSQTAATTLLRPQAMSYAAAGSYDLSFTRDWSAATLSLLAPLEASTTQARFLDVRLGFSGESLTEYNRLSFGNIWRKSLSANRVLGFNSYLDLGQKPGIRGTAAQATFGLEYEIAHPATDATSSDTDLTFGGNVYLPFADYTSLSYTPDGDTTVPRYGLDGYVSWSREVREGVDLGARFSLFGYAGTDTRLPRGIGTLSFTSKITTGLPKGMSFSGGITGRFSRDEPVDPGFRLKITRTFPTIGPFGLKSVGGLQPSATCYIGLGATPLDQLHCGTQPAKNDGASKGGSDDAKQPGQGATKTTPASGKQGRNAISLLREQAQTPEGAATVPAPERELGYGTIYVP